MSQYGPPGGGYPGQSPRPWPGEPAEEPYDQPSDPWGDQDPWAGAQTSGQPGGYPAVSGQPGGYPAVSGQPGGYPSVSGQPGGYPPVSGQPGGYPSGSYPPGQPGGYPPVPGQPGGYSAPSSPDAGFTVPVSPGSYGDRYPAGGAGGYPAARAYEPGRAPAAPPGTEWAPVGPVGGRGGGSKGLIIALVALAVLVFGGGATAIYMLGQDEPGEKVTGQGQTATPAPSATRTPPSEKPVTSSPAPQSSTDARFVKAGQCVKNEGSRDEPRLAITSCSSKTWKVLKRYDGATTGEKDAREKCSKVEGYTDWYFFDSPLDVLDYVLCLKSVDD